MNAVTKSEPVGLALLRAPFPPNQISKLPKPYKKDSPKGNCKECGGYHGLPAAHLDYVGHAALTDRLLDVDQAWQWEPLATDELGLPAFDRSGGLWIKLTVCGVTRLGYGHAAAKSYGDPGMREKEVIGDALRNAAMRFGAALDLWHKGELHADGEDQTGAVSRPPAANESDDYSPPEPIAGETRTLDVTFPTGPAKNITNMKALARALWREIEGCGDTDQLNCLLDVPENKALLKQMSELENPNHREIWEGDGKDNPGIAGLITRKETEFAQAVAGIWRAG